jgi:hypothetical protein
VSIFRATEAVHFVSKLSKVIGDDGAVGSGVGIGVEVGVGDADGVGVGETFGEGNGEAEGAGVGFAVDFFCQTSLLPTFLQTREPDVEFTFAHFDPNLGAAP